MSASPFVVGQWVRGGKFYGRSALIAEILDGNRNWLWLLGTRRVGKTSILRQIELLATESPEKGFFPVFWDFQGADTIEELNLGFGDALLDAEERLEEISIAPRDVESEDMFDALRRLRRMVRAKKMKLLLLCDEVEELITLQKKEPSLLRKLRRFMQSNDDIRSVFASTILLWELAEQRDNTSPFLHGFLPPLYIHNLSAEESRKLIHQANLDTDSRPRFSKEVVEKIREHCNDHPYLLQLVCKRTQELDNVDEAIEQVAVDPMVSFFFSVDFEMLSSTERNILHLVAEQSMSTSDTIGRHVSTESDHLRGLLHRLEHLGFIGRNPNGKYELVNYFFRRWFMEQARRSSEPVRPPAVDPDMETDLDTTVSDGATTIDGRYELKQLMGEGTTGKVYKAYDNVLRVDIAIKMLRNRFVTNAEVFERFRQEIVLAREISHPNILRIYHLGQARHCKYLTMQWVGGPDLAQLIEREAPFSLERTRELSIKLLGALECLHGKRILHRDIKPQNILLEEGTEEPLLSDFGLSRLLGQPGPTSPGIFLGTPQYASPEQARLLPLDERSDLYSIGLVLFEMATGQRPFRGTTSRNVLEQHKSDPPPSPSDIDPRVPAELSAVILRCLEKEPDDRFASAGEARRAVEACGG